MRTFLDTSSLIKLYHQETGSVELRAQLVAPFEFVVTQLTWAESTSSFARIVRRGALTTAQAQTSLQLLRLDWPHFEVLKIRDFHYESAADLIQKHHALALRSLDAIQLAAALTAGPLDAFFTHDDRLQKAATAESLPVC